MQRVDRRHSGQSCPKCFMLRTTCPSSLFVKYLKYVQDRAQQHSLRHRVGPMRPYPSLRIYSVKGWGRECHFLDTVVPIFQKINILTVVRLRHKKK